MTNNIIIRHNLSIILLLVFSGCSSSDSLEHNDENKLIDIPEINEDNFQEGIRSIDLCLEQYVDRYQIEDVLDFEPCISELKDEEWTEDVQLDENALFIKVRNGGYIIWGDSGLGQDSDVSRSNSNALHKKIERVKNHVENTLINITDIKSVKFGLNNLNVYTQSMNVQERERHTNQCNFTEITTQDVSRGIAEQDFMYGCENKRVLIANVTDGEKAVASTAKDLDKINALLEDYFGLYKVDYKKGSEVTIDFLQNHLTDYGLIFLVAHGIRNEKLGLTFVRTGTEFKEPDVEHSKLYEMWKNSNYAIIRRFREKNDLFNSGYYWGVSPYFFSFLKGTFENNSIMVTGICSALDFKDNMGDHLLNKGLGAFIGFKGITRCKYVSDALKCILNMYPRDSRPNSIELQQSFDEVNRSPYDFYYDDAGEIKSVEMLLKSASDNIGLFSTVSEAKEVNLGLPWNWASANIGADNPSESGDFLVIGKCDNPKEIKTGNICGRQDADVVTQIMGEGWQLPPASYYAYIMPMDDVIKWDYNFVYKGKKGARVTGPSGESIFLPYYGRYEVNSWHNDSYPNHPYDNNYSTALPFGQIIWDEESQYALIYFYGPSCFRYDIECSGIKTGVGVGKFGNYSYDFHGCRFNVRGVRPNKYYIDEYRIDYDVNDFDEWRTIFR